jgi:hypothetical protein
VTPNHQGDGIPKSNEHNEVIEGEGEVILLESVAHSRKLESSLKNNNQGLGLRERKRGAQDLDLKGGFAFSEWPTALGGRWGSIYNPHLKRVNGRVFTRLVWWDTRQVRWNPLEAGLGSDKSGETFLEVGPEPLEAGLGSDMFGQLDKSDITIRHVRWGLLEASPSFLEVGPWAGQIWWRDQISPVERKKMGFGNLSTSVSPNFFDVSLLIVRLAYDSNKNIKSLIFDPLTPFFLFPFWIIFENLAREKLLNSTSD